MTYEEAGEAMQNAIHTYQKRMEEIRTDHDREVKKIFDEVRLQKIADIKKSLSA
jgi:hypothetical protein